MKQDPHVLRDQAAGSTLKRIGADRQRVSEALRPALEVIERRLFDPGLDVNGVWRESGLSKKSSTLFKAQLGEPPQHYIGTCRVEVAAKLVAGTNLKISVIADAVGYATTTNTFTSTFQSRLRMSPSEYRLAMKNRRDGARSREDLPGLAGEIDLASAAGDFESASRAAFRISAAVREREIRELSARLALACHERGAQRTLEGDVDRAYDDLALARDCYGQAGDLEPGGLRRRRYVPISHVTDEALISALCRDCGTRLAGDEGRTVRQALRQALRPVPRDLAWFEACCDDCYRVAWQAVSRARAGLVDDAWRAWWISTHADLADRETPPSRGRIIAALTEVERLVSGDQRERKGYCDLALDDAVALGDPLLEVQARIWRASVLRATGELAEAREQLRLTAEASREMPWLSALQDRMTANLETETDHFKKGVDLFRSATELYKSLDPHIGGLVLIAQAIAHGYLTEQAEAIACNQEALSLLDGRRDPLPGNGIVPLNMAAIYTLLGDCDSAESALSMCRFERAAYPTGAAKEILARACLELLRGRARESVCLFAEVKKRFEKLHQPLDIALAASYSVEAHARLDDRVGALENAVVALRYFEAAGCAQNTLEAAQGLQMLVEAEEIDVMTIAACARRLARRNGGWLPESG